MIVESAVVLESTPNTLWVATERQSLCASCSANKVCGSGSVDRWLSRRKDGESQAKQHRVRVLNPTGQVYKPGQRVQIGLSEDALLRGSLWLYGLPMLGLLGGAIAGQHGFGSDVGALFGAIVGVASGLVLVAHQSRRLQNDPDWYPVVLDAQSVVAVAEPIRPTAVI